MSETEGENSHEETEVDTHKIIEVDTIDGKRSVHEKEEIKKKTKIEKTTDKTSENNKEEKKE